jgi:hypothetical protein
LISSTVEQDRRGADRRRTTPKIEVELLGVEVLDVRGEEAV